MDQFTREISSSQLSLPDADSPYLQLSHPVDSENEEIWGIQSAEWRDALTIPQFKEECAYLMTVPLAKDHGMTQWVLVDKRFPPGKRVVLASCETLRKRSLISDSNGNVSESVTHGVAGVYCRQEYRRRGYASRMLRELGLILPKWQVEEKSCVASILYSDIGGEFYSRQGWNPVSCHHIAIDSAPVRSSNAATPLLAADLEEVCGVDEKLIHTSLARPSHSSKIRFVVLPDVDHIRWHHAKEEFAASKLLGQSPDVKGAIAGEPGKRVWAIWTHRFYEHPANTGKNVLYILRLVLEAQSPDTCTDDASEEASNLRRVLEAAQAEAAGWNIPQVHLWDPSPAVVNLIRKCGIPHRAETRTREGIACLRWYDGSEDGKDPVEWIYNEKYAWC